MNYFDYESRSKEKIKEAIDTGLQSQAYHRSGVPKSNLLRGSPKLVLILLGMLGILGLLVR